MDIAESTMCRFLQRLKLTRKKTKRNVKLESEAVQQQREVYWSQINQVRVQNLVFLDEMGIQVGLMREMARSFQGTRVYDFGCLYRGKRVNIIGAMSLRGVVSVKPLAQSLTGELFKEFLRDELIP